MNLGDKINCSGYCKFEYNESNKKVCIEVQEPFSGIVVGEKIKYEGTYVGANYSRGIEGDEYVPPTWIPGRQHKVIEVKSSMKDKIKYVKPSQILK